MSTIELIKEFMMLESLYVTKSRVRQDILTLFFSNPSKKYYLRELERMLSYSAGNIRRELLKFMQDDLFLTEKVANLLYYSLNIKHPLYKELKSIILKTSGITARIKKEISNVTNIEVSFIYGSLASGQTKATSDIDILIIGNPKTSDIVEKFRTLEEKFGREINFTIYKRDEFMEKKNKTEFIKDVLKKPKIFLIGTENEI
ncbi:MAG: nucleotidyltransferase domain-containing protein [Elusimicrobiota bacterium]|nr:nucleotidyltransferase domain-containing protein [Elusimicrobiota bacterium]